MRASVHPLTDPPSVKNKASEKAYKMAGEHVHLYNRLQKLLINDQSTKQY